MAPVYNNLEQAINTNTSTNGTFNFERGLMVGQITHFRLKPKIKLGSVQTSVAAMVNKEHVLFMDHLSLRTKVNNLTASGLYNISVISENNYYRHKDSAYKSIEHFFFKSSLVYSFPN